jgi:hypothetical protein
MRTTNNKYLKQAILLTDNFLENFTLQHFLNLDDNDVVKKYDQLYEYFEHYIHHDYNGWADNLKYSDIELAFINGYKDVLVEIASDIEGDLEDNVYELSIFVLEPHCYQRSSNEKFRNHFGIEYQD